MFSSAFWTNRRSFPLQRRGCDTSCSQNIPHACMCCMVQQLHRGLQTATVEQHERVCQQSWRFTNVPLCVRACARVYSSMVDCSKYRVEEAGFDISALKTSPNPVFQVPKSSEASTAPRFQPARHSPEPRHATQGDSAGGRGGTAPRRRWRFHGGNQPRRSEEEEEEE